MRVFGKHVGVWREGFTARLTLGRLFKALWSGRNSPKRAAPIQAVVQPPLKRANDAISTININPHPPEDQE
jgi:hypothetical protein